MEIINERILKVINLGIVYVSVVLWFVFCMG